MDYASFVDDVGAALAAAVVEDWLRSADEPVVVWQGDIGSTLVFWMAREIAGSVETAGEPTAIVVDHGLHLDDGLDFVTTVAEAWSMDAVLARNDAVLSAHEPGDEIAVSALPDDQRETVRSAGVGGEAVRLDPDAPGGEILLRSTPRDAVLADRAADVVFTGAWRDTDDRSAYAARREDPSCVEVQPLRHLEEYDVWRIAMDADLPVHPGYSRGYRRVRSRSVAGEAADRPAWEQVLDPIGTAERSADGTPVGGETAEGTGAEGDAATDEAPEAVAETAAARPDEAESDTATDEAEDDTAAARPDEAESDDGETDRSVMERLRDAGG